MNRWLMTASLAGLLALTTGCLHHNTRGGCQSCNQSVASDCGCNSGAGGPQGYQSGGCQTCQSGGNCGSGNCGHRLAARGARGGGGRPCQAGPLGWQQGGLDYSSHLNPGVLGHRAGQAVAAQPFQPGPPAAQVAYPYYTHRGPRDFLLNNPPSIGP